MTKEERNLFTELSEGFKALSSERAAKKSAYNKAWYEANKEKRIALSKKYYEENKEKRLAQIKAWYEANKEEKRAKSKQWNEANPEKNLAFSRKGAAKRRADKKQASGLYSEYDALVFSTMVQHCIDLEKLTGVKHHVDHIVPLNHKDACGLHTAANWQVVPAEWNMAKGNRNMEEFIIGDYNGRL